MLNYVLSRFLWTDAPRADCDFIDLLQFYRINEFKTPTVIAYVAFTIQMYFNTTLDCRLYWMNTAFHSKA